jgi:hypothetical protein
LARIGWRQNVRGIRKYISPPDAAKIDKQIDAESGNDPGSNLYDLDADPDETNNLATKFPRTCEQDGGAAGTDQTRKFLIKRCFGKDSLAIVGK